MDPLSIIASTITVVQATVSTYKAIQHLRGLPEEFNEVGRRLPLADDTLRLVRHQLEGQTIDEQSKAALEPSINGCEAKAKQLRDVFANVKKGEGKDGSIRDIYRRSLLRWGKAHRVENLMKGLLCDLDALATNQLFRAATQNLVTQLKDEIDKLSDVVPDVPDSELDNLKRFNQTIESGGTGYLAERQYINPGSGQQYNVSGSGHTMNFGSSSEDRRFQILQALYTSPYRDRKNRNPVRVPGTCEWFIGHEGFKQWQESELSTMLWVSANPGCGKSVLARYLVDSVLQSNARTTCYFFFKDDFSDQRTAADALCCILHQIFTQRMDLFSDQIFRLLEAHRKHLACSFNELWDALVVLSQYKTAGEIVCILDAFDECTDEEQRKFASALRNFYDPGNDMKKNAKLKFLVTSRPYDKIKHGFEPLNVPELPIFHLRAESDMVLSKIAQEIDIYIENKVCRIRNSRNLSTGEEQLLLRELRRIPNRTYLWVYLTLELVESEIRINKNWIYTATSTLPQTVDDAYDRILKKSTRPEEAKKMLHIIVAAVRPLTLAEMDLALNLRQCDKSYKDIDGRFDSEDGFHAYVRNLCGLFVNITESRIYLLHQSAKEFLVPKEKKDSQDQDLFCLETNEQSDSNSQLTWKSSLQPEESHRILCQICIWRLLFVEFETQPRDEILDQNLDGTLNKSSKKQKISNHVRNNFLEYSATNWATHFRATRTKDNAVIELLQQICDSSSKCFQTWFGIYWLSTQIGTPPHFTNLMVASYFGIEPITTLQLELDDTQIDARDSTYQRSALSWAAENGFDVIVKLLITFPSRVRPLTKPWFLKGPEIDAMDIWGRTPLLYAAWNGHRAVIQQLVWAGARVDSKDNNGGTPITYALFAGQYVIAKQLQEVSDGSSEDEISWELLLSAAGNGDLAIVKRLLDSDSLATVAVDSSLRIEHLSAADQGQVAVLRQVREKNISVDTKDEEGRTALSRAAENGREAVVRFLLNKGADIESKSKIGHTPLLWAAENGHERVVQILLDGGADIEARGQRDATALLCATRNEHNAVARLLIDRGANVMVKDAFRATPLLHAAQGGCELVVRLLLDKGADVEYSVTCGFTPLLSAAGRGHQAVVWQLLERGANVEARFEITGSTALHGAAHAGYEGIVRLLLNSGADIEGKNIFGSTALHGAALAGQEAIVRLLLDAGAKVEIKDRDGKTPLELATAFAYKNGSPTDNAMTRMLRLHSQ